MKGGEFDDVESVWSENVGLALQEMLCLETCDLRDGREDVGRVAGSSFHAVAVVYLLLPCFFVRIEFVDVVVEVSAASRKMASQESGMGCVHRGNVQIPLTAQN